MKVGFIGLGAMGVGMVRNIATTGMLTAVYNRTSEKAQKLASELNVATFESPQQLAAQIDVLFICVSADHDVLELVNSISKTIQPGSVVVDMSTISSKTVLKCVEILSKNQVSFLDAPVSGGVEGAKKGTLAMMVGGEKKALNTVYPILQSMSSKIVHMGRSGTGQGTKAVNQVMAAGINQAVTESLAFAQAQGLNMEKVIEVISGGAAGNWFLQHRGMTMVEETFKPGFKLVLHDKDLKICQQMAAQVSTELNLVNKTLLDYEKLIEAGYGDEDISALYRLKKSSDG